MKLPISKKPHLGMHQLNYPAGVLKKLHREDDLFADDDLSDVTTPPRSTRQEEEDPEETEESEETEVIQRIPLKRKILGDHPPDVMKIDDSETVRLSADIRKDLHLRIRLFALLSGKPLVKVLEEWIIERCPGN